MWTTAKPALCCPWKNTRNVVINSVTMTPNFNHCLGIVVMPLFYFCTLSEMFLSKSLNQNNTVEKRKGTPFGCRAARTARIPYH
jgi:hypothetical protein